MSLSIQHWRGKVRDRAHAPQQALKMDFRCALITHLEHDYSAPCCGSKNSLNNS